MAKLYAELSSDKQGRTATKGGNDFIKVDLLIGNRPLAQIWLHGDGEIELLNFKGDQIMSINAVELSESKKLK